MIGPRDQPPPYSSIVNSESDKYVSVPLIPYPELTQIHGQNDISGNINPAVQHSSTTYPPPAYYNSSTMVQEAIPDQRIAILPPHSTSSHRTRNIFLSLGMVFFIFFSILLRCFYRQSKVYHVTLPKAVQ